MNELVTKVKKLKAVSRARNVDYLKELQGLAQIRKEKAHLVEEIVNLEGEYMYGIKVINDSRQSSGREGLYAIEDAVEHAKMLWFDRKHYLSKIEEMEFAQLKKIVEIKRDLQGSEKLITKYLDTLKREREKKEEMANLDMFAGRIDQ